jgi:hypothetical protein
MRDTEPTERALRANANGSQGQCQVNLICWQDFH